MTASPPASQHALHCLIVEDQVMFLQLLRSMLEAIPGLEVRSTATSQAEAIALCRSDEPPELLILDLSLPDGDGLAVAHTLAESRPEAKVVVLSGQASSFVCPAPLRPLIVGVVDKTAAFSQLQAVLERCLPHRPEPLTPRQQEIYRLIGQGLSNKDIAKTTELSIATVETHRKAIAQKLGMSGAELVRQASLFGHLNQEHLRRPD
jgi:DNA-binding NarL/FixJ family response regulator